MPNAASHCLFLQATLLFPHDVTIKASFLLFTVSNSSLFTPALLKNHSFVFFAVRETRRIFFSVFHLKGVKTRFFIPSECPAFTAVRCYRLCSSIIFTVYYFAIFFQTCTTSDTVSVCSNAWPHRFNILKLQFGISREFSQYRVLIIFGKHFA